MQEVLVDTPEAVVSLAEQLAGSEWLALDTEFIREKTYWPKLCLLQVSNGEIAAAVDTLSLSEEQLRPLLDVFYDGSILKVFHAARQDLEIFLHDWGHLPLPLFDTQTAAALLGYGDQIGYANLVKRVLDIDLAKDQSRTDWSKRPLNQAQIRYALDDVVYLGAAYTEMRGRLSDRERLQWLAADFAELANPAIYVQHPQTAWKRVKGRQHLRGAQMAILQVLAAWREEQALEQDRPRRWILKDEVLVDLAKRAPTDVHKLSGIRGLEPGTIRRHGETLIKLIEQGKQVPKEQWPVDKRPGRQLSHRQEALVDLLSAALRLIADQHQLSPTAIATRKELEKLVLDDHDTELMRGWRKLVAGEPLLAVMSGEKTIRVGRDGPYLTD